MLLAKRVKTHAIAQRPIVAQKKGSDNTMNTAIRTAQETDVAAIVELAEQKRLEYQNYQPVFWKKAADSREKHLDFVSSLLKRTNIMTLVHEEHGAINGFIIATLVPAPPVYDVPGLTCSIDDFTVARKEDWEQTGRQLLEAMQEMANQRGAAQVVVVCGHLDQAKRAMLQHAGLSIASEWYTAPL